MSQTVSKDVKHQGNVVATINIELFDNLDEAEGAIGEDKIIEYVNRQRTIELMDNARREATGGGGTGIRALMAKLKDNPELLEQVKALAGQGNENPA